MPSRQSKSEEAVMAGDGGRVPDVSEQRAEIEAVVEAAQAVVDTQAAIVRACTPSDPEFLHAQGANMVPEERDQYAALFSRWHRTTRNLAAALDRVRDARGGDEAALRRDLDECEMERRRALSERDRYREERNQLLGAQSPSRDGTVAAEAVATWLETRAQTVHGPGAEKVADTYRAFLAAFGPARAGVSNEGGNQ